MGWIRKDVADLIRDPADQTLHWYARGVAAMKQRPITDRTSWLFQAAMHGQPFFPNPPRSPWADVDRRTRETFWDQCQHQTWFFLPWHRMYLGFFEEIVRAAVVAAGGPKEWALPYWNYSKSESNRLLPPPFREERLDDGNDNPLYVAQRTPSANAGAQFMDAIDVGLEALEEPDFSVPRDQTGVSFGGQETPIQHFGNFASTGTLENTPHNQVHVQISGWMGNPNLAALDPIFWLHHANIDRLWDLWLRVDGHSVTDDPAWTTHATFPFVDASGNRQDLACGEVVDAAASRFDYSYDDAPQPSAAPAVVAAAAGAQPAMKKPPVSLATATRQSTRLTHDRVDVGLPRPVTAAAAGAGSAAPTRKYLSLEGITADKPVGSYDVYVCLPPGRAPEAKYHAGRVAPFGIAQASDPKSPHGGGGLSATFDVTALVHRLEQEGVDVAADFKVSIVPVRHMSDPSVAVQRIALYEG